MHPPLHPVVRRFVQEAGSATQSFGMGRVIGQVYAYLYFQPDPCSLDDLQAALGISKGSASMVVRQLEQWGAVQKHWVRGDRKDYYTANDTFGRILKSAVLDTVGKRMGTVEGLLVEAEEALRAGNGTDPRNPHLRDRVSHLRRFQRWARQIWNSPVLRRLLR